VKADSEKPQDIPFYRDNPCIGALPPIWSAEEVTDRLLHLPRYDPELRSLPAHLRLHLVETIRQIFLPLSTHLELEQQISRMIRQGYLGRNPADAKFWAMTTKRLDSFEREEADPHRFPATPTGFVAYGIPGMGKTSCLLSILSQYPDLIRHTEYRGRPLTFYQIPWLYMNCQFDGSIKGFCHAFLKRVDTIAHTRYLNDMGNWRYSITDHLLAMATVAANHCVGLIAIDEIQYAGTTDSPALLRFLVQLVNTMGVPVLVLGTYKALRLLCKEFHQARRSCGPGDLEWKRHAEDDEEWKQLVEVVWSYQYTKQEAPLSPDLSHALYQECQGITDILIKVVMLAQMRAITTGREIVTPAIIESVARDRLTTVAPILKALRTENTKALKGVQDFIVSDVDTYITQLLEQNPAPTYLVQDLHPVTQPDMGLQLPTKAVESSENLLAKDAVTKKRQGNVTTKEGANPKTRSRSHETCKKDETVGVESSPLIAGLKKTEASGQDIYDVLKQDGCLPGLGQLGGV